MLLALLYSVFRVLLDALVDRRCPDASLRLELLVLRHQLRLLERQVKRPRWGFADRLTLAGLSRRLPPPDLVLLSPESCAVTRMRVSSSPGQRRVLSRLCDPLPSCSFRLPTPLSVWCWKP